MKYDDWLRYDQETGHLWWLRGRHEGKIAGCTAPSGYIQVRVEGVLLYGHRLAVEMGSGQPIPSGMLVDHINRCKSDNRLRNLRLTDKSGNGQNQKPRDRELPRGVCFDRDRGRYRGYVALAGKDVWTCRFDTVEEATAAAAAKRRELGFLDVEA